jgi:RNA polymerase sigma-70 factor (ECF subfamily)
MGDDELVLLDRWCAGDTSAGNTLFKLHFASVYRFFERKVEGDLDELVQETFLACLKSRDTFRRQSSFKTYLLAIARHVLFGYWRRRARQASTLDFDEISVASLSTSAGSRIARREDRARLLHALRALPLDQQLLLELHYWEELERDRLAEVFDIEPATTRSRLFRARQALRELLAGGTGPPDLSDADLDAWARGLRPQDDGGDDAAR